MKIGKARNARINRKRENKQLHEFIMQLSTIIYKITKRTCMLSKHGYSSPILASKAARSAFRYYSQCMPDKTIKCV